VITYNPAFRLRELLSICLQNFALGHIHNESENAAVCASTTLKLLVGLVAAFALKRYSNIFCAPNSTARLHPLPESSSMSINTDIDALRKEWCQALAELPSTPDNIPAFFLAHGREWVIS